MATEVREVLASVRPLLGSTAAYTLGNSLLGIVLPLRMEAVGYPIALTGLVMAAYYLGLALAVCGQNALSFALDTFEPLLFLPR